MVDFLKDTHATLSEDLVKIKPDVAYLSDLFAKFNEVNLQLQGNGVNLIKVKSVILGFMSKIDTYRCDITRRELCQFPSLSQFNKEMTLLDDDLDVYCLHLKEVHRDVFERFHDLYSLEVPDWIINPFLDIGFDVLGVAKEELISLRHDLELKPKFKVSYQEFWLQR